MFIREDEKELIERKDQHMFLLLFAEYYTRLCRYAYRLVRNEQDAEDIVQTLFDTLSERIRSYKGRGSFDAWIFRCVRNLSLDFIRSDRSGKVLICDVTSFPDELSRNPEEFTIGELEDVMAAQELEILYLHYISGFTLLEIGKILNLELKIVRKQNASAKRKCKEYLKDRYR